MTRSPFTPNAKALFSGVGVAGATAVAVACIPDLPPDPLAGDGSIDGLALDASGSDGWIPPGCGDGYIDLSAGEQCDPGPAGRGASVGGCNPDCTMQCGPGSYLWPRNNHCYELATHTAGSLMIEAERTVCGVLPGSPHVATFASDQEFAAVAANVDAGWFWVGLQEPRDIDDYLSQAVLEPGWSAPCSGCYIHNPNPMAGLPQGNVMGTGGAYCVQASSDLNQQAWQKIPCGGVDPGIRVICEHEPVGSQARQCPAGTCFDLVWTYGQKTYVFGALPLSADAAEQTCRGLGGRLVVLGARDEREQLWKQLDKVMIAPSPVWIGLAQQTSSGAADAGDAGSGAEGGATSADWIWDDDASADAYPSPWGWGRPRTTGANSTRAYLYYEQPAASDDTLARNDGPMPFALPYVCELPAGDGGAPPTGDP